MMAPAEEQRFWSRFLEGDDESLETIYRTYFDELYNYGYKWLHDRHLVEDVIQDLFVKLIKNRKNLSRVSSVKFYLFRSFKSVALDRLRPKKNQPSLQISPEMSFPFEFNAESELIHKEEHRLISKQVEHALEQLTPKQREALYLKYILGFSYPEISDMMEISQKATYKLMARALNAMRDQMLTINVVLFLLSG